MNTGLEKIACLGNSYGKIKAATENGMTLMYSMCRGDSYRVQDEKQGPERDTGTEHLDS